MSSCPHPFELLQISSGMKSYKGNDFHREITIACGLCRARATVRPEFVDVPPKQDDLSLYEFLQQAKPYLKTAARNGFGEYAGFPQWTAERVYEKLKELVPDDLDGTAP